MRIARLIAVVAVPALATVGLSGCALFGPTAEVAFAEVAGPVVADPRDPSAASIAASRQLFASSQLALVATGDSIAELADDAARLRVPLLVDGPGLAAELERLGVETVGRAAGPQASGAAGWQELDGLVDVVELDPAAVDGAGLPRVRVTAESPGAVLVTDGGTLDGDVYAAVSANVSAAAGTAVELDDPDPRAAGGNAALAREHAGQLVVGLGAGFGPEFPARFAVAATQPELPGGGHLALEGRLLVADYGQPGDPLLGVLGEHDLDAAVERVLEQAAEYEELTGRTVVPTFEIIATVASGAFGDGDYSNEASLELLRPWVDRAAEEGIYVVLDLQPGLDTFVGQAQQYAELLAQPHVGLALDSEWRLAPGQLHNEQIGGVTAAEVNDTLAWLAQFTADLGLPQKAVVIHQFAPHMIEDRETLDTSHDELALLVHVDGHGTPGEKLGTWELLLDELPEGIALGWKNFIDEDTPMFTPEDTVDIEPMPAFVSYQ